MRSLVTIFTGIEVFLGVISITEQKKEQNVRLG